MGLIYLLALDQGLADAQLTEKVGDTHRNQRSADDAKRLGPEQARKQYECHDLHGALSGAGGK